MENRTAVLEVKGLNKSFRNFRLQDVSFALREGQITGFIGINGAGKSTTLNSVMDMVNPDSGDIKFWGMDMKTHAGEIKQRIGFVSSGLSYFVKKKIKAISEVTKSFYDRWDDDAYNRYMYEFRIDENKMPEQLSNGMKIKYSLALALSHNADLLILDEPTSGLDPVSREDILENFMDLSERGKTILFSTHITSDLDKCADNILYIRNGVIQADSSFEDFVSAYMLAEYDPAAVSAGQRELFIAERRSKRGQTALVKAEDVPALRAAASEGGHLSLRNAALDEIMVHLEKEYGQQPAAPEDAYTIKYARSRIMKRR